MKSRERASVDDLRFSDTVIYPDPREGETSKLKTNAFLTRDNEKDGASV